MNNLNNPVGPIKSSPQDEAERLERNRPAGVPKNKESFKKIYTAVNNDKTNDDDDDDSSIGITETDEAANPFSLFASMSKKKARIASETASKNALADAEKMNEDGLLAKKGFEIPQNPNEEAMISSGEDKALDGQIASSDNLKTQTKLMGDRSAYLAAATKQSHVSQDATQADATTFAANKEKVSKGSRTPSGAQFDQANPDLSYINPAAQAIFVDEKHVGEQKVEVTKREMAALVDKIVQEMRVIEKDGITHTTVRLNYPPVLEGSQLTLTTSEASSKQFTIAFTQLSIEAKELLDAKLSKDSLQNGLNEQGFVVNTITTTVMTPETQTESNPNRYARDEEGRQQGQQQREEENG